MTIVDKLRLSGCMKADAARLNTASSLTAARAISRQHQLRFSECQTVLEQSGETGLLGAGVELMQARGIM
jgi:hypothetical protein